MIGRRSYRPTYAQVVAREDAERAERETREPEIAFRVTWDHFRDQWPSEDFARFVIAEAMRGSGTFGLARIVMEVNCALELGRLMDAGVAILYGGWNSAPRASVR